MAVKKVAKRKAKGKSPKKVRTRGKSPRKVITRPPRKPSAPMVLPRHGTVGRRNKRKLHSMLKTEIRELSRPLSAVKKVQVAQIPAPITLDEFAGRMHDASSTPRVPLNFKSPLAMMLPVPSPINLPIHNSLSSGSHSPSMSGMPPMPMNFGSPIGALPKGWKSPLGGMHMMMPGGMPSPGDMISPTNGIFNFSLPPAIEEQMKVLDRDLANQMKMSMDSTPTAKPGKRKKKGPKFTIPKDPLKQLNATALGFDLATLGDPAQIAELQKMEKLHQAQFPGAPPLFGEIPTAARTRAPLTKAQKLRYRPDQVGTMRQVWNGTKQITKNGLRKCDLIKNKKNKIVSRSVRV